MVSIQQLDKKINLVAQNQKQIADEAKGATQATCILADDTKVLKDGLAAVNSRVDKLYDTQPANGFDAETQAKFDKDIMLGLNKEREERIADISDLRNMLKNWISHSKESTKDWATHLDSRIDDVFVYVLQLEERLSKATGANTEGEVVGAGTTQNISETTYDLLDDYWYSSTQMAKFIGVANKTLHQALIRAGWVIRHNNRWVFTDSGLKHNDIMSGNGTVKGLKFRGSGFKILNELCNAFTGAGRVQKCQQAKETDKSKGLTFKAAVKEMSNTSGVTWGVHEFYRLVVAYKLFVKGEDGGYYVTTLGELCGWFICGKGNNGANHSGRNLVRKDALGTLSLMFTDPVKFAGILNSLTERGAK